jgi:hypothetical protein
VKPSQGTAQEWEHFKSRYNEGQLKVLENNADLKKALDSMDYIRAQEIACELIHGSSDAHIPRQLLKFIG